MRALGEMWMDDAKGGSGSGAMRAQNAATATGYVLASELRACGVDFSFTPVLDLDWGDSQVIGDRAFHRDPRVVTVLAKSLMLGLLQAGMANCGKHFPGHGFVALDSHVALPVDKRPLKDILADDAMPYAWLQSALTAVMPGHVIYSRVDKRPAGFSPRWLQGVLRQRLGFEGAVFSDDLSMAAARQLDGRELGFAEAALEALGAGCDFALVCNQSLNGGAVLDELIDTVARAVVQGDWQPSRASAMRRQALLPATPAPDWDSLMVSPRYVQALALMP
jgi:beta-N-acetylhexosaminidase